MDRQVSALDRLDRAYDPARHLDPLVTSLLQEHWPTFRKMSDDSRSSCVKGWKCLNYGGIMEGV